MNGSASRLPSVGLWRRSAARARSSSCAARRSSAVWRAIKQEVISAWRPYLGRRAAANRSTISVLVAARTGRVRKIWSGGAWRSKGAHRSVTASGSLSARPVKSEKLCPPKPPHQRTAAVATPIQRPAARASSPHENRERRDQARVHTPAHEEERHSGAAAADHNKTAVQGAPIMRRAGGAGRNAG